MTEIKPAATIQVIREKPEGGIEVLLLRRNRKLKFASGFWVYPGGKIEGDEIEQTESEMAAAKIAAAREAHEEASINIDPASLRFFVHWTTPENELHRFGTYFFHTKIEYDQSDVIVDNSEILEHKWMSPSNAFEALKEGGIFLLPPTYITLQRIRHCRNYEEVLSEWERSDPVYINPIIGMDKYTVHCMYQGDAGYQSGDFTAAGSRHRLIVNYKEAAFEFQHENCQEFPVNGGRHIPIEV